MKRRLAGTALLMLATAGCGLTVPLNESGSSTLTTQSGGDTSVGDQPAPAVTAAARATGAGSAAGARGTTTAIGAAPVTPTTSVPGAATTVTEAAPSTPSTKGSAALTRGSTTRGSTTRGSTTRGSTTTTARPTTAGAAANTKPILVGVEYYSGIDGAASALGVKGLATGDTVKQAQALADDINSHGGINGRMVTILGLTSTDSTSPAQAQQDICTQATQDHHVDVFVSFVNAEQNLAACIKAAGAVYLNDEGTFGSATAATLGNSWFGPADLTVDRLVQNEIQALAGSGWMTKANKVGIFGYNDTDATNAINNVMKPALAALGIPVVSIQTIASSSATTGGTNVALNFRTAGVDRVLNVDASPLFVMEAAANQGYTPKWGMLSNFGPGVLLEGNAPTSELEGAQGPGYLPYYDIGAGTRPVVSANETRCHTLETAAGQGSTDTSVLAFQGQICDLFFFLHDAGTAGGGVTPANLQAGAAALGTWPSAVTFSSSFPGGRSTGAGAYRMLAYTDSCSCFQYTSGLQPLS